MNFKEMVIYRNRLENCKKQIIQKALASVLEEIDLLDKKIKDLNLQIKTTISELSKKNREKQNKDYGIINFKINDVKIKHDRSKKVIWDQKILAQIRDKIKSHGSDPYEYINEKLDVSESKFKAWPEEIKNTFMPARIEKKPTEKIVSINLE